MIDWLDGVERATDRVTVIGGDRDLKSSVHSHSLHRFATVNHKVNL